MANTDKSALYYNMLGSGASLQMQFSCGLAMRSVLFAVVFLRGILHCHAEQTPPSPDVYKAADGSELTKQTLTEILTDHCLWVESQHTRGKRADLRGADLSGLRIRDLLNVGENGELIALSHIDLSKAILRGAVFNHCDLRNAHFNEAKLQGAVIVYSNLDDTIFDDSDLSQASFFASELPRASFVNTKLEGTYFALADITGVVYEPKSKSIPDISSLSNAVGLDKLRYRSDDLGFGSEAALIELRSALKGAGLREQERQVNYAIQHGRLEKLRRAGGFIEWGFQSVFFDLTCKFGMLPGRPLQILVVGIFVFAVPYFIAIYFGGCWKRSGIWAVRIEDTVHKRRRKSRALPAKFKAMPARTPLGRIWQVVLAFLRGAGAALYFSALSAFSIGYREINVGSWISRVQSREYTLRATGWVRCVAGLQSLLSAYLLALWVLTYFGRPFE